MGAEYWQWEHRILRGLVSCWMWMFEEQKPWKRGGPVCQTFCALKRIKSIENWMRANYSRGRSDVLLGDGWVGAWGFKLITPALIWNANVPTLCTVLDVCTFCTLLHPVGEITVYSCEQNLTSRQCFFCCCCFFDIARFEANWLFYSLRGKPLFESINRHGQFWYMAYWMLLRWNGIKTTAYSKISNAVFDIKYLLGIIPIVPNCQYSFLHSEIATVVFMSVYLMCVFMALRPYLCLCVCLCVFMHLCACLWACAQGRKEIMFNKTVINSTAQ